LNDSPASHNRIQSPLHAPPATPLASASSRALAVPPANQTRPLHHAPAQPAQLKKRARILPHSRNPTLFTCRLENPAEAHRKRIAHGPAPFQICIWPCEPLPPKTKAAHVANCEPLNSKMVASKSAAFPRCCSNLEQAKTHFNRYRRPHRLPLGPVAALHRHVRTVSIVFSSNPSPGLFATRTFVTRSSVSMITSTTTIP